jgi:hypothetical protein
MAPLGSGVTLRDDGLLPPPLAALRGDTERPLPGRAPGGVGDRDVDCGDLRLGGGDCVLSPWGLGGNCGVDDDGLVSCPPSLPAHVTDATPAVPTCVQPLALTARVSVPPAGRADGAPLTELGTSRVACTAPLEATVCAKAGEARAGTATTCGERATAADVLPRAAAGSASEGMMRTPSVSGSRTAHASNKQVILHSR